jgi:hypothetical protein
MLSPSPHALGELPDEVRIPVCLLQGGPGRALRITGWACTRGVRLPIVSRYRPRLRKMRIARLCIIRNVTAIPRASLLLGSFLFLIFHCFTPPVRRRASQSFALPGRCIRGYAPPLVATEARRVEVAAYTAPVQSTDIVRLCPDLMGASAALAGSAGRTHRTAATDVRSGIRNA